MPESLLARRLKLGRFLGIELYVHWSFSLAVAYVALMAQGNGWIGVAFAWILLVSIFLCVTLHEYGHALAARKFGIGTADITLLPIGGVARLERMPRIPWQELVVAVAGPAVNVVIAAVLVVLMWAFADSDSLNLLLVNGTSDEILTQPSLLGLGTVTLMVNLMLIVFNMIPAFPMDGGRVFRSLLAMVMNYSRATSIASKVGLVCAALMVMAVVSGYWPSPILVLIAVFIGYAGLAEARQVEVMEAVRGLKVRQVMIHSDQALSMDMPLSDLALMWRHTTMPALPVLSIVGTVIGMLRLRDVTNALSAGTPSSTTAGQLLQQDSMDTVQADEDLGSTIMSLGKTHRQFAVTDQIGHLLGILDLDSMMARRELPDDGEVKTDRDVLPGANVDWIS